MSRAWECLAEGPKTYDDLIVHLKDYAAANIRWVDNRAVGLIVRTLSIAKCFNSDGVVPHFENMTCLIKPAVGLEEALFWMNITYLNGIRMSVHDVVFDVDVVAILLFDELTDTSRAEAKRLLENLGVSSDAEETAMSLALKMAGADQESVATESS